MGDLYVTRYGWPRAKYLLPQRWYLGNAYTTRGHALSGATGHVYRFPDKRDSNPFDLVIKVSRFAQDVPLVVRSSFPDEVPEDVKQGARFNSPFEEFGLVKEMRTSNFGPEDVRIRTKLPVAVFMPSESLEVWQLGRSQSRFHFHQQMIQRDAHASDRGGLVRLYADREYFTLFAWIDGIDAESANHQGDLSDEELRPLMLRVINEMSAKGFRMLDNKPRHVILRQRRGAGELLRRNGRLAYALVDFELLVRTNAYQAHLSEKGTHWPLSHPL
jgi:hypothetical protein